jgi:Holliday junction DNA helicase RuvB
MLLEHGKLGLDAARLADVGHLGEAVVGAEEIAARARGTPRIAGRLLKRVRDFAAVSGWKSIGRDAADAALSRLEVDKRGLDAFDRRYLTLIAEGFCGGPVGIETIAAALGEARDAIEEIVEPYLIQQSFVQRTPRGRVLTGAAYAHIGLPPPQRSLEQQQLFGDSDE